MRVGVLLEQQTRSDAHRLRRNGTAIAQAICRSRESAEMRKVRSGFTLIELLVVIAIIAILAAILFPVFAKAKERGREAACKSNMKQIGTGIQLYLGDWNGAYPDQTSAGFPYLGYYDEGAGNRWMTEFGHRRLKDGQPAGLGKVLGPYLKNLDVFKCPSEWKKTPEGVFDWGLSYNDCTSYYIKHAMMFCANMKKQPLTPSQIVHPSRASMLYEPPWHGGKVWPYIWARNPRITNPEPFVRLNCIFLDCHVGTFDVPYFSNGTYDANWYLSGKHGWDLSRDARDR